MLPSQGQATGAASAGAISHLLAKSSLSVGSEPEQQRFACSNAGPAGKMSPWAAEHKGFKPEPVLPRAQAQVAGAAPAGAISSLLAKSSLPVAPNVSKRPSENHQSPLFKPVCIAAAASAACDGSSSPKSEPVSRTQSVSPERVLLKGCSESSLEATMLQTQRSDPALPSDFDRAAPLEVRSHSAIERPAQPHALLSPSNLMHKVPSHALGAVLLNANNAHPSGGGPRGASGEEQASVHDRHANLIRSLESEDTDEQCGAANTVANLFLRIDDAVLSEWVHDGVLAVLVKVALASSKPDVQRFLALAFFRLAQRKPFRKEFADELRCLEAISYLSKAKSGTVWRSAARCMAELCAYAPLRDRLIEVEALGSIRKLALSYQTEFRSDALRALVAVSTKERHHEALVSRGGIELIAKLAQEAARHAEASLSASQMLWSLAQNAAMQPWLECFDVIRGLVILWQTGDHMRRNNASRSLANVLMRGGHDARRRIGRQHVLAPICMLLGDSTMPHVRQTGICALVAISLSCRSEE